MTSGGGLLAASVEAFGSTAPPRLTAFRGTVKSIAPTLWQIDAHVVQVNAATKIVGDPHIGDTVDVIAETPSPVNPGAGTTTIPVALSIFRTPIVFPPGWARAERSSRRRSWPRRSG